MAYGFYRDEGAVLPHKPIPLAMFLIVEDALRVSWERLKTRVSPRIDIRSAKEDDVTHDLYEVLFDEVFDTGAVDGFDEEHFSVVTRETKLRNYNGGHLDKMPDLMIRVAGRTSSDFHYRSQDWLFIECKPVDEEHTVGVHYGGKGIARFIRGDYAWTMTSALMVGYASQGYTIEPKLMETCRRRGKELAVLTMPEPCRQAREYAYDGQHVYSSTHHRSFTYIENGLGAPPIQVRHLWLDRV